MAYGGKPSWPGSPGEPNPFKLNDFEANGLRITKQAFAKSFIEAGVITERTPAAEKLLEDWIRWTYRDSEKDFKLVKEQEIPF